MKIVTVIGARPQFIKAAAVSRALAEQSSLCEVIVHTGQHYDEEMSTIFFSDLGIPEPAYNLEVGSGSHAQQTGSMLIALEPVITGERPDLVLVYGDTNSTLAGALVAAKLNIPIAHVEAGLRSYNRLMPEEINRELTDRLSRWLFCPTQQAVRNLEKEGIRRGVHQTGDVMFDMHLLFAQRAEERSALWTGVGLEPADEFYLATIHRRENTGSPERMRGIFAALEALPLPVVLPLHPGTRKAVDEMRLATGGRLRLIAPVSYLDMALLRRRAKLILTDSGGMQKEAYFSRTPCVTMRDETEWVETVEAGWNRLAGASTAGILAAVDAFEREPPSGSLDAYGDGTAACSIAAVLNAAADETGTAG